MSDLKINNTRKIRRTKEQLDSDIIAGLEKMIEKRVHQYTCYGFN